MNSDKDDQAIAPIWEYIILIAIIVSGFIIRYPLVNYNLPVAANVDERMGLKLLFGFQDRGLNPEWFGYPSFYYYITFFLSRLFGDINSFLFSGRIWNLVFSCALAVSVFCLSKHIYKSGKPSLIAAALTMFSPIIIYNSSYIITDILLATLSVLSLLFFTKFFDNHNYKFWLLGILVTGLAIATKYTALILIFTYLIAELFYGKSIGNLPNYNWLTNIIQKKFNPLFITYICLVAGILFLAGSIFFPWNLIYSILQTEGALNSVIDSQDLIFLNSLKAQILYLGIFALIGSLISWKLPRYFQRLCLLRPYIAVALMFLVFLLGTPYIVVGWKTFLYQFGGSLKLNALASHTSYWLTYIGLYINEESLIILLLFFLGLIIAIKRKQPLNIVWIYLIVYYMSIGSSQSGYARYLTPFIPIIFMISAYGIDSIVSLLAKQYKRLGNIVLILVIVATVWELHPKASLVFSNQVNRTDALWGTYHFVNNYQPNKIYFAGNSPSVELTIAGFDVEQIHNSWLNQDLVTNFSNNLAKQIVIFDRTGLEKINGHPPRQLKLLWSKPDGDGQYIYEVQQ